ncbi:arginine deiminase family protein [Microcoleus sp. T3_A4]|uniref:arginine deiminase family protein n=1 Tax=Microcoleus sp. T3_A4 TaxID=2818968 RepID=UPI002FD27E65
MPKLSNFEASEFSLTPKAVIVHDPSDYNVFSHLKNLPSQELQENYLFRALPDAQLFREDHQDFANSLNRELKTFYVSDILRLKGEEISQQFSSYLTTNPNLVYTRDAIITMPWVPDGYIIGRMVKKIRQKEPEFMSSVAKLLGLKPILEIPEGLFLEGGDVIPICYQEKKYLAIGYGRRTTRETLDFLISELLPKGIIDGIIGIELAQWRINLDGGMVPVAEDCIIAHPESLISGVLLDGSETAINPINFFKDIGFNFIEVTQEESLYKQACNCFCLGGRRIFAYDLCERVQDLLKKSDVEVIKVKGQELVKGTGGPRCMTRPIYMDVTL